MKKIYILGQEGTGWSIDKDRYYTIKAIINIPEYKIVDSIFEADIIYAIWWNQLLSWKFKLFNLFFKKKIIATITNDLSHQKKSLKTILNIIDIFVYANKKQKQILIETGVSEKRLFFNPFYVDETKFTNLNLSKEDICKKLDIDFSVINNKILIGSFQRDSLGTNLLSPKWQKNPDMLIDILRKLDNRKYLLVLAGPRRHYLLNKCKEYNIEYLFIGNEHFIKNGIDDLRENSIDMETMPYLYNLIDLYIVSSKSEGGPKAIPESLLCQTRVISTSAGFSEDLLDKTDIYNCSDDAVKKILDLKFDNKKQKSFVNKYYSYNLFKERIKNILGGLYN